MKVLVAIKRVIDYKAVIRLNADGTAVETNNVKMSMNPFDEIAIEAAVQLKEKNIVQEIIVVSIGTEACQETIRTALAIGADRGILIKTNVLLQPLAVAKLLQALVVKEGVELVILGKQAIDSDNNQVGQMLAGKLDWAQGTFASSLDVHGKDLTIVREIDGGLETLKLTLPAVITTDLRLNTPRYISLPNIVKAKTKPIAVLPVEDFNIDITARLKTLKVAMPEKQRRKIKLETVTELVQILKKEAVI